MADNSPLAGRLGGEGAPFPLLATKLYVPTSRPGQNLVSRRRLTEQLAAALRAGHRLTLVSAPAGFGKTTLLSEWARTLGGDGSPGDRGAPQIAWLSLDEGDNDPGRFLSYLAAALQRINPAIGRSLQAALQSPHLPPPAQLVTSLINDVAAAAPHIALVLDDYHAITSPAIHEALAALIEHLPPPPAGVHLVIASRADPPLPLSRLRARGQMTEIRAAALRFRVEEATVFLNELMGLNLSATEVTALEARTEGWIAGLQLAALSMQGREDAARFIADFSGSHRYVLDYLADEVLNRQPEATRQFLRQTAVLDRLSGPLCNAVTGRTDSQAVLETLEANNLFLVPLDERRGWYRYHHLFAGVLRHRLQELQPDQIPELHRRAAAWYEANRLPADAVSHALAARDFERAAALVDAVIRTGVTGVGVFTVGAWLLALPEEQVRTRPRLLIALAWLRLMNGQIEAVEPYLLAAERILNQAGSAAGGETGAALGEIAAIRGEVACSLGDVARTVELSRQALALLPEEASFVRGIAATNIALNFADAYDASTDVAEACRLLAEAVRINPSADAAYTLRMVASMEKAQGRLRQAAQTYHQALEVVAGTGGQRGPGAGIAHVGLGELHYEWNDLAAARRYLLAGLERGRQGEDLRTLLPGYVALARLNLAEGNAAGAREAFLRAEELARECDVGWLVTQVTAARVWLWLAGGDLAAAGRWARECGLAAGDQIGFRREGEYLALARALIALGDYGRALDLLDWLLAVMEPAGLSGVVIEILALTAVARQGQGRGDDALAALERALALAEPEGYVRAFVDEGASLAALLRRAAARGIAVAYGARLLAAFGGEAAGRPKPGEGAPSAAPGPPALVEPLTGRELEVLRLIAAGLTNQEIAGELIVVVGTVKGHVNKIYRKLDVTNRVQAVSRARELDLL